MPFITLVLSFVVGFSIGMIGVGGVFLTPILILTTGMEISSAMGTALTTFIGTGLLGTYIYHKEGSIDWDFAIYLFPTTIIGALIGSNLNLAIGQEKLESMLALFLILMAIVIFAKQNISSSKVKGWVD